ncbi:hypothetical protein SAMN02745166_04186 [Prosthecobacter debontii]|uniref:Alpha/beta hydrolase family protein n=1 Tax=Prosthecobacter debontii TaxID=48467 RepID=A0A1T4YU76_9BACT|nr:hypothetical protein [Prosthecobacter debontii]SKB05148.1 hypothetical protein SAMN02745166_04186 [Prosthecobacter debontii]
MKLLLLLPFLAASAYAATPALEFNDPNPQRYDLSKRASEIDPRAKEHPEIDFVFTDKKGKPQDLEHASVDTRVKPQGKLVIWLMGHSAPLFERLNGYGLHAIQVHYANKWFGIIPAARRDDGKTLGDIRLEAATGEDHSDLCAIPKPDGMMERAFQLVKWLSKENPQGKWQQFINAKGDGLDWDKVIVSGASHGATTSARFAKHQKVDRVVCFCGPRDQLESWQSLPSATPGNRIFAFSHVLDSGWTGDHYCRSWEMMGLNQYGPIVNVDEAAPPYANTRRLITDFDVKGDAKRAHGLVTPGGSSAKGPEGKFLHEAVWNYLFNHPVDEVGDPTQLDPSCEHDLKK